jgi:copper transport protein
MTGLLRGAFVAAIAGLIAAVAWSASLAVPALAHAALEGTDPDNGALLEAAPDEIRLAFTEPPDLSLTTVELVDASGATVPTGDVRLAAARRILVPLDALPDGVFTVSWRTVSKVDGHVTAGAFTFGVGVSADEVAPVATDAVVDTPAPTPLAVAGRWGLYAGLAVLLGGALAGSLVFGATAVARRPVLAGAWVLAAAGVVAATLAERADTGVSLGTLLASDSGAAFVRLAVAVSVVGVGALAVALRPGAMTLAFLAAASVAAMVVRASGGHAGGSEIQVVLQATHLVAVGAWIGGLVWLVLALRRGLDAERVRHYSNIAAVGLAVLFATGFLRATDELGGPGWWLRPFDTEYGTALVVKLGLVVALVALGALNRFRNVRRVREGEPRPLLRTVRGELALAAAVFVATGVLTGLPPQETRGASGAPPEAPRPLVASGADFATTTRVRLEIAPGTVGANAFVADVVDYDTGEPVRARRVSLRFELPGRPEIGSELPLERGEDGSWQAGGTALSVDGTWDVSVLVQTADGSVEVPLSVTPRPPNQRIEVSRAEGQPDLYTISFDGGLSMQAYVDPGQAGRTNQVHVTAFDADGAELPLDHVAITVVPPGGAPVEPEVLALSPGHVVANVDLEAGTTTFQIEAMPTGAPPMRATFEQTFDR